MNRRYRRSRVPAEIAVGVLAILIGLAAAAPVWQARPAELDRIIATRTPRMSTSTTR